MTRGDTPAARPSVACVCRRPWSESFGTPAAPTRVLEELRQRVGVYRFAVLPSEHVARIGPRLGPSEAFLELALAVGAKLPDGRGIACDGPGAS
jgi:hypothetical protein